MTKIGTPPSQPTQSFESKPPPPPPGSGRAPQSVNIMGELGNWISKGFSEVFASIGGYIVWALAVGIVSGITFGILAGPLLAGSIKMIRRKLSGKGEVDIGAVFSDGFAVFLPSFLVVLIVAIPIIIIGAILNLIPILGTIVSVVVGCAAGPMIMLGLYAVIEEKKDFMPAIMGAWEIFQKDMPGFLIFGIVAGIVSGIGSIACGVGVLVTMPVGLVMTGYLLNELYPPR